MIPSSDQIAVAAYYRWERRNFAHGRHAHDWFVAEHELTFAAHYELIARLRIDGVPARHFGDRDEPRCRFCERTAPRAPFTGSRPALPASLGNESLFTFEECDDCRAQFDESIGGDLDRFLRTVRLSGGTQLPGSIPIAALKGLAWGALAILPQAEMEYFEDTVEWVSNPDHDLDCQAIPGMECIIHRLDEPSPFSWASLARRLDDDAPFPYLLAFFGTDDVVLQVPVPLCPRDEDLEGNWSFPRVASPFGVGRSPLDSQMTAIPLSSAQPQRGSRLSFLGV